MPKKIVGTEDYKINKRATVGAKPVPQSTDIDGGPTEDAKSPRVNPDGEQQSTEE